MVWKCRGAAVGAYHAVDALVCVDDCNAVLALGSNRMLQFELRGVRTRLQHVYRKSCDFQLLPSGCQSFPLLPERATCSHLRKRRVSDLGFIASHS